MANSLPREENERRSINRLGRLGSTEDVWACAPHVSAGLRRSNNNEDLALQDRRFAPAAALLFDDGGDRQDQFFLPR